MSYDGLNVLILHKCNTKRQIAIIDAPENYNILSGDITFANKCGQLYNKMTSNCFKHLVLTRKIAWQHPVILDKLSNLDTAAEIAQFFSFYSHDEIMMMIIYKSFICNTLVIKCCTYKQNVLYSYIMDNLCVIIYQ